jgi:PAS domain S-box-containing protein
MIAKNNLSQKPIDLRLKGKQLPDITHNSKQNLRLLDNILLVEDEFIPALAVSKELKNYGYNVIHVLHGKNAIEAVRNEKNAFDLILMDIELGEQLDGTEIAKIILKDYDIPLMFFTSHTENEIADKTEGINFYGYVDKNSGIAVLDASIKMAFRLHENYQNLKSQKIELELKKNDLQIFEKRYQRLFESAKDGILILNAENGMIVDVNPFLINMLGYSKEQFLSKHIWDINNSDNIDYSKQMFKELQDKEYVRYEDLPLVDSDGKLRRVEFVSNVYLVDKERVIQCNVRDITERIKHEQILKEDMNKKEALLKEMQHRTKNSFNMISSLIHIRTNVVCSEETKETLEELSLRVKAISELYSLLYETDSYYEVQLKSYCSEVINSMLSFAKYIEITKDLEEIIVSPTSAATIGMILVELLTNAIKYAFPDSAHGKVNIKLKLKNLKVILIVEDNGVGIGAEFNIEKIKSIGLHLVDLMISQLDGKIKFIPAIGTKIVIEIPLESKEKQYSYAK